MRTLKPNERRLVLVFGTLLFALANLLVLEQLSQKKGSLESETSKLRLEKVEVDFWLAQRDLWNQRREWLDKTQPKMKGEGQESADLLEVLQKGAKDQKVIIGERTIIEPSAHPHYTEIAVQIQAKAPLEAMSRWLVSLQNPEAFQALTNLTLKRDADSPNIICSLTLSRWYRAP